MAPPTSEAEKPYNRQPTPTLVIRQTGEAWSNPFAVVYEPFESTGSVQSVESITQNGAFKGLKIKSMVAGQPITQLVLVQERDDSEFNDAKTGLSFRGRYAVATLSDKGDLQSVYIGRGKRFSYKKAVIATTNGQPTAAFVSLESNTPNVSANDSIDLTLPSGQRRRFSATN